MKKSEKLNKELESLSRILVIKVACGLIKEIGHIRPRCHTPEDSDLLDALRELGLTALDMSLKLEKLQKNR